MANRGRIRRASLAVHIPLLFAWFRTAYAYVEPPANVTFHCHNLHDLLRWRYEQPVAGLRFRVDISSLQRPPQQVWVDPPALHANLSLLTDPVDDNRLTVTAVVGEDGSEAAPAGGVTFSYFGDSLVGQKCSVDFPPVAVAVDADGHILLRFEHPWLSYGSGSPRAKSRQKKSNRGQLLRATPEFTYSVSVNQHLEETFTCDTVVCKEKLQKDPGQDTQCLSVKGVMEMMSVLGSRHYCASPLTPVPPEKHKKVYVIASVLASLCVLALALIAGIVYKKKTRPPAFSPNSTRIPGQRSLRTLVLPQDPVLVPEVEPRSPVLLLNHQNGEESETPLDSPTQPDLRFPLGVEIDVAEEGRGGGGEYVPGGELEEAVSESPYERRQVVVELAPGEEAAGYRQGAL